MGFDFQFLFQNKPTRGYITRGGQNDQQSPLPEPRTRSRTQKNQQVWNVFILNLQHERLKFLKKIEIV